MVEKASITNRQADLDQPRARTTIWPIRRFEGDYFLAKATQVKNVWIPYGA
jgi:aldehyde dehydrogenase (NAD+)